MHICLGLEHKFMEPLRHIRTRVLSGLLLLVPLAVTVVVVKMVFGLISTYISPMVAHFLGKVPGFWIPIIAVCIFVLFLYLVGLVTAFVVGRRLLALGESIILRIPLIKSVYSLSKQVVDVFATSKSNAFRSVVVVEFPRPGLKAVGFVTGTMTDVDGRELVKVFIPTAPNPTTGFLELVPAEQVQTTDMKVEDAFTMLISGGVISPERLMPVPGVPKPVMEAGATKNSAAGPKAD